MGEITDKYPKTPGVYFIYDKETGLTYIGSSGNLNNRMASHRTELKHKRHYCLGLQEAHDAGRKLDVTVVPVESKDKAIAMEQSLLNEFHNPQVTMNKSNLAKNEMLGVEFTDKRKKMLSERMIGNSLCEGRVHSDETRKKISDSNKGKVKYRDPNYSLSEEARERISRFHLGNKWALGREVTEETRRKISESNTDKVFTEEHKARLKEAKCFPLTVDGVEYRNAHDAARALGVSHDVVKNRIKNPNYPGWKRLGKLNKL